MPIHDERYNPRRLKSPNPDIASREEARANLMKEQRLAKAADQKHTLAVAAERDEKKLPSTDEALGLLGAGKKYGE